MTRVIEKVGLLVLPRVIAMDFSIAAHVLGGHPGFELLVAGHAGYAGVEDGVSIVPSHPLTVVDDADVVVVPGFGDPHVPPPTFAGRPACCPATTAACTAALQRPRFGPPDPTYAK